MCYTFILPNFNNKLLDLTKTKTKKTCKFMGEKNKHIEVLIVKYIIVQKIIKICCNKCILHHIIHIIILHIMQ